MMAHLVLKGAKALTSASFSALPAAMPHLHTLNATSCYGLDDADLSCLADGLPNLRSLSLRRCHKVGNPLFALTAPRASTVLLYRIPGGYSLLCDACCKMYLAIYLIDGYMRALTRLLCGL